MYSLDQQIINKYCLIKGNHLVNVNITQHQHVSKLQVGTRVVFKNNKYQVNVAHS